MRVSAIAAALSACLLLPAAASANPTQGCDGTHHSDTGHGANQGGPYDNTCDGSPSANGNGGGQAVGRPCAGCVGNADDKNPHGQMPNGSDHNAGYECDSNHGVGRTNPAHTGCKQTVTPPPGPPPPTTTITPAPTTTTTPTPTPTPTPTTPSAPAPTQTVLGERQQGTGPSAPSAQAEDEAPEQEVLGEEAESPPSSAVSARPSREREALPFSGIDTLVVLLAGAALLLAGFGLRRLAAGRS